MIGKFISTFLILGFTNSILVNCETFHLKLYQNFNDSICTILNEGLIKKTHKESSGSGRSDIFINYMDAERFPAASGDALLRSKYISKIIEIFGKDEKSVFEEVNGICDEIERLPLLTEREKENIKIKKIIDGGDQENRIDVVFMGDGYTSEEESKFYSDIERLTNDMFYGVTFKSYLPLFNIWAVYVPSQESGIGYNGPKNTPFKLYRENGQLRAIFTGNAKYARQVCKLVGPGGCDYPSLIGNDDFYGGLGGEFIISTKSNRSGTVVLRHEMGHNFVFVGEEYDSGYVYRGVNAARSISNLGWKSWLSGAQREEKATYRLLEYPWQDLKREYTRGFFSDGQYSKSLISVSVSAAGEEDSLEFILDGQKLPWESTGFDDREFYDWANNTNGFSLGYHSFTVRSKTKPTNSEIPRMICSVNVHEFGNDQEFIQDNSHVSAYPTFDFIGRKSFRPTNAGCIMRNMSHHSLCSVCKEGMWMQFLQRISLIDNITEESTEDGTRMVTVNTIKLGQLRKSEDRINGEQLKVTWEKEGTRQSELEDQFTIMATPGSKWRVTVKFISPEIRDDKNGYSEDTKEFTIQ